MNLAKVSANGQITVPVEIRRALGLQSGDKVLFWSNQDGEIVLKNASAASTGETKLPGEEGETSQRGK
ncbi:MAG: AbrB/MazE/SpoVT family DNA-binding domain-containing protein [Lachnospiraceae bacterium]|nr:AbrB/MazE/SpoVT family DNA-binding domain-containing protein [Lachnospiraceae bacterium]